jgi:hypothetical protein
VVSTVGSVPPLYVFDYLNSANLLNAFFGSPQTQFAALTNVDQYVEEAGKEEAFLAARQGSLDQSLYAALQRENPLYPLYNSQGILYGVEQPTLAAGALAEQQSLAASGVLPAGSGALPQLPLDALAVNQPTLAAETYLSYRALTGSVFSPSLPPSSLLGLFSSLPPGTALNMLV